MPRTSATRTKRPAPAKRRRKKADKPARVLSKRKSEALALAERHAAHRDRWIDRNAFYYGQERTYMRFLVTPGASVLELGCGTGGLLAALEPKRGVGLDFSPSMIEMARDKYPGLDFRVGDVEDPDALAALGEPFDFIILSDTIGWLDDCQRTLALLKPLCHRGTRVIVTYYGQIWSPMLRLAEATGLRMPHPELNWLSSHDIANLLGLADFEPIKRDMRQLLPKRMLGLGWLLNRYVATLPGIRRLCLRQYVIARPAWDLALDKPSATVIVPCRNERGNIEPAVTRTPDFCEDIEMIFVEGGSSDGTFEECKRVAKAYPDKDIKVFRQPGTGKGDAMRKGYAEARGDVLMILDADLTVPPEMLPKFYEAIAHGRGEFINGTRLVYPMEPGAMRFLNTRANRAFARIFSWLLNQRFTDTLCGTKVLRQVDYEKIAANRSYFGDFDPFGDFDLIFGAAKLNLKIVEVPIRYADRSYGETQISRFSHGWLLMRMVAFAYRKLKAF